MATSTASPMVDALFLAVHASNPIFKHGFQPLSITLLSLPFVAVMLVFGPTKVDISPWYPVVIHSYPYILGLIGVFIVGTKVVTTFDRLLAQSDDHNVRNPYVKSYWTPFVEHAAELMTWGDSFWTSARNASSHPIFVVIFGGTKHNIIFSPTLWDQLESQSDAVLSRDSLYLLAECNTFGIRFSRDTYNLNADVYHDVLSAFDDHLTSTNTISRLVRALEQDLPNLLSFNPSQVDKMLWERSVPMKIAGSPIDPQSFVETTLSTLTREFVTHQVLTELFGQTFTFEHPNLSSEDFKDFNSSLWALALDLSRMFPAPGLVLAAAARNRLIGYLIDWVDDTSNAEAPILVILDTALAKSNTTVSKEDRARFLLLILWKTVTDTVGHSFYLLYRLLASAEDSESKALLASNIAKLATATQPAPISTSSSVTIAEPPQLNINTRIICTSIPSFFTSALTETKRLDHSTWSVHQLKQDITLQESTPDVPATPQAQEMIWKLKAGERVHIARSLHHSNPKAFDRPGEWQIERFSKDTTADTKQDAKNDSKIKSTTKINSSSETFALAFVAGVLSLWDIEILDKRYVKNKVKVWPAGWRELPQDVPVRMRRRKIAAEGLDVEEK